MQRDTYFAVAADGPHQFSFFVLSIHRLRVKLGFPGAQGQNPPHFVFADVEAQGVFTAESGLVGLFRRNSRRRTLLAHDFPPEPFEGLQCSACDTPVDPFVLGPGPAVFKKSLVQELGSRGVSLLNLDVVGDPAVELHSPALIHFVETRLHAEEARPGRLARVQQSRFVLLRATDGVPIELVLRENLGVPEFLAEDEALGGGQRHLCTKIAVKTELNHTESVKITH